MKILVAVDQSGFSEKVLDKAIALARSEKAELVVMTVIETTIGDLNVGEGFPSAMAEYRQTAEAAVAKAADKAKAGGIGAVGVVEESASAAGSIVDYASSNAVDLIVMGHKGKSALERFLIGSVASKVVSHAPCSVYVVR